MGLSLGGPGVSLGPKNRILGALGLPGASDFATRDLWGLGEQGLWYDPSDFERYMAKGPELVTNGDFSNGTAGWQVLSATTAPLTVVDGSVRVVSNGGADQNPRLFVDHPNTPRMQIGKQYEVAFTLTAISTGRGLNFKVNADSSLNGGVVIVNVPTNAVGTYQIVTPVITTAYSGFTLNSGVNGEFYALDNISVRELTALSTATLFQDAVGTTPVTAMEQPRGLVLDKRLGLVRGVELAPLFSNNGWTPNGSSGGVGVTRVGTTLRFSNVASADGAIIAAAATVNNNSTYEVTLTVANFVSGTVRVVVYATSQTALTIPVASNGTHTFRVATAAGGSSNQSILVQAMAAGTTLDVTSISVRELPGNHATQSTTTARPVLSARKNLFIKTEDFSAGGGQWGLGASGTSESLTVDAASSPVGSVTADMFTALQNNHSVYATIPVTPGAVLTFSWHAKTNTLVSPKYSVYNVTASANLISPTVYPASIADLGDGWYRYAVTTTVPAGCTSLRFYPVRDSGMTGTIYLWGAQLELGPTATRYQRVNTATDYDWVGFPMGDKFDGVDDFMTTATGGGGNTGFFYCAALKPETTGVSQILWSDRSGFTGYRLRLTSGNQLELSAGDGVAYTSIGSDGDTVSLGVPVILTAWDDGTQLHVQINRGLLRSVARPAVVAGTASFTEGRDNGASTSYLKGTLMERVYVKNGGVTATERARIQESLAGKVGVTL